MAKTGFYETYGDQLNDQHAFGSLVDVKSKGF